METVLTIPLEPRYEYPCESDERKRSEEMVEEAVERRPETVSWEVVAEIPTAGCVHAS